MEKLNVSKEQLKQHINTLKNQMKRRQNEMKKDGVLLRNEVDEDTGNKCQQKARDHTADEKLAYRNLCHHSVYDHRD